MKSKLYAAAAILGVINSPTAHAGVTEKVLYSFTGGTDGAGPSAPLLADTNWRTGELRGLYSTATAGGIGGNGTAFELLPPHGDDKAWAPVTLWGFTGGADGSFPAYGSLFSRTRRVSSSSTLYGTTAGGATGGGTIFSLAGTTLSTIWTFTGGADGANPYFGVVADKGGALYAAGFDGGSSGCGSLIQLTPPAQGQTSWTETTLYSFTGGADGCGPNGVIIDSHGVLYGTTYYGGTQNEFCGNLGGCGTVFALIPPQYDQAGWTERTIWSFQGGTDGAASFATLTAGKNGTMFGTTAYGGGASCSPYGGCGTVFEVTPPAKGGTTWTEQVIAAFAPDGSSSVPYAAVIIDKAGALYGTTSGTSPGNGTVFRLAPPAQGGTPWSLETLFTFPGSRTGSVPEAPLTADGQGVLYGTTYLGGLEGDGIVFSLTGTGFVPQ